MARSWSLSEVKASWGLSLVPFPGIHIDRITGNANRTLCFLRRNIKTTMSEVQETAYNTLCRPRVEYASAVLDHHTKVRTSQIKQVQRRKGFSLDSQQL